MLAVSDKPTMSLKCVLMLDSSELDSASSSTSSSDGRQETLNADTHELESLM